MAKKGSSRKSRSKRSFTLPAVVVVVVIVLVAVAMNYHFVLTKNDFKVLTKAHWGAKDTFVNTRSWGPLDWIDHSDLLKAMVNDTIDNLQKEVVE
jgi:ABC-type sugar transport system permease subunit